VVINLPKRLNKPCSYPGCPELVRAGNTYCETHRKKTKKARDKEYNKYKRNPKTRKFYGSSTWKKARARKLSKDPICEYCLPEDVTPATEVDHIIPIEVDWSLRLVESNFKSACHSCHMKKSAEDRRKYDEL